MYLGEDRVNIEVVESFVMHALEEEADGCGIGDVEGSCSASTLASATSEEATNASEAVNDDRTRVAPL